MPEPIHSLPGSYPFGQDAAWKIFKERIDALQQACASLGQLAGLGALAPLAGKLQSMSQDIGIHGANIGG